MEELIKLDLSKNTIKTMVEMCPNLLELNDDEIRNKMKILEDIGCSYIQIRNIVSSNADYLDRSDDIIFELINRLKDFGFSNLNLLFDANPYILSLESFEIDDYVNSRLNNGEILEDIVDELESNPYLFSEI